MRRIYALPLLTVLFWVAAVPASADEVELAAGYRFVGTVVSLDGGMLTFETPYGEIRIPWNEVTALVVTAPILATVGTGQPVPVTIAAGPGTRQAVLEPGGPVALEDVVALARPQPALVIDGGAGAGVTTTEGNTEVNNLRLDGNLTARAGDHRYSGNASITQARGGGVETARNWTMGVKYDRFVTPRLFFNANGILTSDRFRDLELRTAVGGGIGWQVLSTPRVTLTTDAGLGYVNETLESQPDDRYTAARESASVGVFLILERVELFHQHDGYFGVTGDDNLFVKMQNGIRIGLATGFVTTLRHDLDYDRSPAPGRRHTDTTLALTLGYRF